MRPIVGDTICLIVFRYFRTAAGERASMVHRNGVVCGGLLARFLLYCVTLPFRTGGRALRKNEERGGEEGDDDDGGGSVARLLDTAIFMRTVEM